MKDQIAKIINAENNNASFFTCCFFHLPLRFFKSCFPSRKMPDNSIKSIRDWIMTNNMWSTSCDICTKQSSNQTAHPYSLISLSCPGIYGERKQGRLTRLQASTGYHNTQLYMSSVTRICCILQLVKISLCVHSVFATINVSLVDNLESTEDKDSDQTVRKLRLA